MCSEVGVKWSYEKSGYGFTFIFYRVTSNINSVSLDVTLAELNDSEIKTLNLIKTNLKLQEKILQLLLIKTLGQFKE